MAMATSCLVRQVAWLLRAPLPPSAASAAGVSVILLPLRARAACALHTTPATLQGLNRDKRKSFAIKREPPLGPHKLLAPGFKMDGRVGPKGNYRFEVHYPKDGKYTIKPLSVTKLGGRNPVTGRKVIEGVGGGCKQKFRWVDWLRMPADWPKDKDLVERVVALKYDPMRTSILALTGYEEKLRWQIATANMKVGDLITTSAVIPDLAVKPVEGNGYPLGALPVGTTICLVQQIPDSLWVEVRKGKESAEILRKTGDRVIVRSSNGLEYSYDQKCICVAGTVSIHPLKDMVIGSPNRARWLGNRPRSGLWQRKGGRFGRKVKKPPPVKAIDPPKAKPESKKMMMYAQSEGGRGSMRAGKTKLAPRW